MPSGRTALFDAVLERAAGELGDLTAPLIDRFYRRFPEARQCFERHALGDRARLEAATVDASLYCVMHWLERPAEVRLILSDQVPHHCDTLGVDLGWFAGLVEELVALIGATVPADQPQMQSVCSDLAVDLQQAIAVARAVTQRRRRAAG